MQKITTQCPICLEEHTLDVTDEQYEKYINGEDYIQNIFSEMSAEDREMLITGICPKCWRNVFGDEEE